MNLASAMFPRRAGSSSVGAAFVTRAVTAFSWVWLLLSSKQLVSLSVRADVHCWNLGTSTDPALLASPVLLHSTCFSLPGAMRVHQVDREMLRTTLSLPLEDNELWFGSHRSQTPPTHPWCSALGWALCFTWSPQELRQEDLQSVTHRRVFPELRLQNLSVAESLPLQTQLFPCVCPWSHC